MRTLDEARRSWPLLEQIRSLRDLKDAVRGADEDSAITSALRSICWKTFLLFENADRSTWPATLADSRAAYLSLRTHFLRSIEHPDELESAADDPLSENEESPWVALRKDEALRAEIFQDVERCMPDNAYFRAPATQTTLLDVLFVWCKLNPDVGYRQGMHELLAPVLWVVERDAIELHPGQDAPADADPLLLDVFDQRFVEHDAFTLFGLVMQNAKAFFAPSESPQAESPMIVRSKRIFDEYLPLVDPGLAAHLSKIDIVPQIFLMRWVRLLFGREFPFNEVLRMWDVIFAEDASLELVDMVCLAMLLRIRWNLMEADTNTAFTLLLRYPTSSTPARTFVDDALYLRANLTPAGGAHLITSRTSRAPALATKPSRISTPTPSSPSSSRPRSPAKLLPHPASLEAMLQDAARNVYSKGEKWGLNKTLRDAVGEVRRNVQGFSLPPPSAASTRYARGKNLNPAVGTLAGESALKRVKALEKRNKDLARLLEAAVAELWACQGERGTSEDGEEKQVEEKLGQAIAKVQFVQVYLEDASIPLPTAEEDAEQLGSQAAAKRTEATATPNNVSASGSKSQSKSTTRNPTPSPRPAASPALAGPAPPASPQPTATPFISISSTGPTTPSFRRTPTLTPNLHPPNASSSRPSITHSSFSWMLGQDADGPSASTSSSASAFAEASPRSALPERRRGAGRRERAFLFGEEDAGDEGGVGEGGKVGLKGKGKGVEGKEEEEEGEGIDLGELGGGR